MLFREAGELALRIVEPTFKDQREDLLGLHANQIDLRMRKVQTIIGRERRQLTPPVACFLEVAALERQVAEQVERLIARCAAEKLIDQFSQRDWRAQRWTGPDLRSSPRC